MTAVNTCLKAAARIAGLLNGKRFTEYQASGGFERMIERWLHPIVELLARAAERKGLEVAVGDEYLEKYYRLLVTLRGLGCCAAVEVRVYPVYEDPETGLRYDFSREGDYYSLVRDKARRAYEGVFVDIRLSKVFVYKNLATSYSLYRVHPLRLLGAKVRAEASDCRG